MKKIFSIFKKGEIAFTALESAIVLTAFVMVAAVLAYVVVGAELTSSYTAGITVNEDVNPATSPIELAGGVIAKASDSKLNNYNLDSSTCSRSVASRYRY